MDDRRCTTEACDLAGYAGLSPISRAGCGTEASGERVEGMEKKVGAWVAKDQTRRLHTHAA